MPRPRRLASAQVITPGMLPDAPGSTWKCFQFEDEIRNGFNITSKYFQHSNEFERQKTKKYFKEGLFKTTIFSLKKCDSLHIMFRTERGSKISAAPAGKGGLISVLEETLVGCQVLQLQAHP